MPRQISYVPDTYDGNELCAFCQLTLPCNSFRIAGLKNSVYLCKTCGVALFVKNIEDERRTRLLKQHQEPNNA